MRISIRYEASWRNSFLSGSNNEPLPPKGREFIGSMTGLKKRNSEGNYGNFIWREISHDTVMGVLNRLIGDQRKLYQSRQCSDYFFADIEPSVTYRDGSDGGKVQSSEAIYLRNISGNTDQNTFTGMIKANDSVFKSVYSSALWGVLWLKLENLLDFIANSTSLVQSDQQVDPLMVLKKLHDLNTVKAVELEGVNSALEILQKNFPDVAYKTTDNKIKPIELYCSALYLQLAKLSSDHDISAAMAKRGGIPGISKRGFTPKDFMGRFTTGSKKPIWGNPYVLKEKRKGQGEVVSLMTKASGTLDINLSISEEKASELKAMIEAAGVSSFYLGKKGLAYVDVIR